MQTLTWLEKNAENIATRLVEDFYESHVSTNTFSQAQEIINAKQQFVNKQTIHDINEQITTSDQGTARQLRFVRGFIAELLIEQSEDVTDIPDLAHREEIAKACGHKNYVQLAYEIHETDPEIIRTCRDILKQTEQRSTKLRETLNITHEHETPARAAEISKTTPQRTSEALAEYGLTFVQCEIEYHKEAPVSFMSPLRIPTQVRCVMHPEFSSYLELSGIAHELGHAFSFSEVDEHIPPILKRLGPYANTEAIAFSFQRLLEKKLPQNTSRALAAYRLFALRRSCRQVLAEEAYYAGATPQEAARHAGLPAHKQDLETINGFATNFASIDLVLAELLAATIWSAHSQKDEQAYIQFLREISREANSTSTQQHLADINTAPDWEAYYG